MLCDTAAVGGYSCVPGVVAVLCTQEVAQSLMRSSLHVSVCLSRVSVHAVCVSVCVFLVVLLRSARRGRPDTSRRRYAPLSFTGRCACVGGCCQPHEVVAVVVALGCQVVAAAGERTQRFPLSTLCFPAGPTVRQHKQRHNMQNRRLQRRQQRLRRRQGACFLPSLCRQQPVKSCAGNRFLDSPTRCLRLCRSPRPPLWLLVTDRPPHLYQHQNLNQSRHQHQALTRRPLMRRCVPSSGRCLRHAPRSTPQRQRQRQRQCQRQCQRQR